MIQLSFEDAHKITSDLKSYIGRYIFGQEQLVMKRFAAYYLVVIY